jgi:enterochelin esterase family protein
MEGSGFHAEATLRRHPGELPGSKPVQRPFVCPSLRHELSALEAESDPARRRAAVDALLRGPGVASLPFIGPGASPSTACVTFLWRGEARFVALAGDMNGWSRARDLMTRVAGTDLFHASSEFPADARLEYKLRPDGEWRLDPLNPRTAVGGYGPNSELRLPGYRPPPEAVRDPAVAAGSIETLTLRSRHLGNGRKARVYLPPGYAVGTARFPVVYLHDGEDALELGALDVVLDNLIAAKFVPPVIAVLVPPVRREREYAGNPAFEAFFVEEVVPAVDRAYRTRATPAARVVGGTSLGALAAVSLALHHPEVFGGCIAQSGHFRDQLAELLALAANQRATGGPTPSFWIDAGTFESVMDGMDLLDESRRLGDGLRRTGVRQAYLEVPEGHSWSSWRARIGQAIAFTLGGTFSATAP